MKDKSLSLSTADDEGTHLFLEKAVEDEDKHSLEGVEYGEEVRHDDRGLVDEEEAEGPREAQQTQQSEGAHDPGSEGRQKEKKNKQKKKKNTA